MPCPNETPLSAVYCKYLVPPRNRCFPLAAFGNPRLGVQEQVAAEDGEQAGLIHHGGHAVGQYQASVKGTGKRDADTSISGDIHSSTNHHAAEAAPRGRDGFAYGAGNALDALETAHALRSIHSPQVPSGLRKRKDVPDHSNSGEGPAGPLQ